MVGIDLVEVDDVRQSVSAHGERYLTRIFDARERVECGDDPRGLAARFAAKEATRKVLGADAALPWRSIAVHTNERGGAVLCLAGDAATLARERRVGQVTISLAQRAKSAVAIVLVEIQGEEAHEQ